jgi:hypothetical protein
MFHKLRMMPWRKIRTASKIFLIITIKNWISMRVRKVLDMMLMELLLLPMIVTAPQIEQELTEESIKRELVQFHSKLLLPPSLSRILPPPTHPPQSTGKVQFTRILLQSHHHLPKQQDQVFAHPALLQ